MTDVPTWPTIRALTHPDGTGELTINGTSYPIQTSDAQQTREEIIHRVTATAAKLGRAVHVAASGPEGQFAIIVHPDGRIESEPAAIAAASRRRRTYTTSAGNTHGSLQLVAPFAEPLAEPDPGSPEPDAVTTAIPAASPVRSSPCSASQPPPPITGPPTAELPPWPSHVQLNAPVPMEPAAVPTVHDLLDSRPSPAPSPAQSGWQGHVRRLTFGLISPRPGPAELQHRDDVAAVQRSLAGPRTIVVINPKGGAHKTTAALLLAATFGIHRGGYTLAWDNNETRGTLGWRARPTQHTNTAVDLLSDLDRFTDPAKSRVGDLDNYVRAQGSAQFDVLASDEDARASATIDADAFRRLHSTLSRFYRVIVVDTGNNMRAANWGAAIAAADQLVVVSTVREDTAASAAWLLDGLRSRLYEDKIAQAVTLLSSPGPEDADPQLRERIGTHFGQLTRAVLDVPYDPALVDGATIEVNRLRPSTRNAWLHAAAVIAQRL